MQGISWVADQLLEFATRLGYEKSVKFKINQIYNENHEPGKVKSETHMEFYWQ
jgi:hypothetical protein